MSSANKLALVLLASSGILSNGQFLKPMVTQSFSSSWTSSSYWMPGRDGQMHQNVHEVHSETFHDHGVPVKHTESETACKDGRCQQTVSIEKPGSIMIMTQQAPAAQSRFGRLSQKISLPPCLRAMLEGLSSPVVVVEERETPVNLKKFLAPRPEPTTGVPAPRVAAGPGVQDITGPAIVPLVALAGVGMSLAVLIVTAIAQCQRSDSREVTLRNLGEPLAPAEEAGVSVQHAARRSAKTAPAEPNEAEVTEEAMPVSAYLDRVYGRAVVDIETQAAKTYLYRVYEQVTA